MVKLLAFLVSSGLVALVSALPAAAVSSEGEVSRHVLITLIQPESAESGSEEIVELYNSAESEVDVTGWQLQYRSAASGDDKKWTTKATIACEPPLAGCKVSIVPRGILTLASYDLGREAYELQSGMALSGGQVRLVQPGATPAELEVHDMVGYGTAVVSEGNEAALAPLAGNGIKRKTDSQQLPIDTDNNKADFELSKPLTDPEEEPGKGGGTVYLSLLITELLPDPASPAQDEHDEFIELYNPHDVPVNVKDYTLEAGTDWRYKFVLPDVTIPPHGYYSFKADQTGMTLSNSGSSARLLDPDEKVMDTAQAYSAAKTGQSWIRLEDGTWKWTTQLTPGAANILAEEPPKVVAAVAKPKAPKAAKKPAAPKTKKPAAVKATKPKAQKPEPVKPAEQAATAKNDPNYWLIGTVAALAGGYALYEYRHDALGKLRKIREARKAKK